MIDWDAFKSQIQAHPRKMLGYVLGIAGCFLVIWILVLVQTNTAEPAMTENRDGRLDSLRISLKKASLDSDSLTVAKSENLAMPKKSSQPPNLFVDALPTFLILLAAIGGIWYWVKRRDKNSDKSYGLDGQLFEKIGSQEVSVGESISVIKINNEFWVIGSGSQGMQLLHRYSEEDWQGPDISDAKEQMSGNSLFASILENKKVRGVAGSNGANGE